MQPRRGRQHSARKASRAILDAEMCSRSPERRRRRQDRTRTLATTEPDTRRPPVCLDDGRPDCDAGQRHVRSRSARRAAVACEKCSVNTARRAHVQAAAPAVSSAGCCRPVSGSVRGADADRPVRARAGLPGGRLRRRRRSRALLSVLPRRDTTARRRRLCNKDRRRRPSRSATSRSSSCVPLPASRQHGMPGDRDWLLPVDHRRRRKTICDCAVPAWSSETDLCTRSRDCLPGLVCVDPTDRATSSARAVCRLTDATRLPGRHLPHAARRTARPTHLTASAGEPGGDGRDAYARRLPVAGRRRRGAPLAISPNIQDGGLRCADGGACPEGFHCARRREVPQGRHHDVPARRGTSRRSARPISRQRLRSRSARAAVSAGAATWSAPRCACVRPATRSAATSATLAQRRLRAGPRLHAGAVRRPDRAVLPLLRQGQRPNDALCEGQHCDVTLSDVRRQRRPSDGLRASRRRGRAIPSVTATTAATRALGCYVDRTGARSATARGRRQPGGPAAVTIPAFPVFAASRSGGVATLLQTCRTAGGSDCTAPSALRMLPGDAIFGYLPP